MAWAVVWVFFMSMTIPLHPPIVSTAVPPTSKAISTVISASRWSGCAAGTHRRWRGLWQNGRPLLAQSDIYYLPYYQPPVHFIGHGIVITGVDLAAQTADIADIAAHKPLTINLDDLQAALHDERPPLLRPFHWAAAPVLVNEIVTAGALRDSILDTAVYMLTPPSAIEGLPAMQHMAEALPRWSDAPDWVWAARFGYQAIEKRGTGGGGFRHLFGDFLTEAQAFLPAIAPTQASARFHALGERWSHLAQLLKQIFAQQEPAYFKQAFMVLQEIVVEETAVLQELQTTLSSG